MNGTPEQTQAPSVGLSAMDHGGFGPRTTAGRNWSTPRAALFAILIALSVVYIGVAFGDIRRPLNDSPYDRVWALGFVAWFSVAAALTPFRAGRRVLACVSVFAIAAVVGASALARMNITLALLMLAWLLLACWAVGSRSLSRLAADVEFVPVEHGAFSIAIGLVWFTLGVFALAACGLLYRSMVAGLLALFSLPWLQRVGSRPRTNARSTLRAGLATVDAAPLLAPLMSVFACCLLASYVWAVSPEISYDGLNYRLAVPQIYVQNHRLFELSSIFYSYLLGSSGMLYAGALALLGQPLPQLIHLTCGVIAAVLTYCLGARVRSGTVGLLAAALFYSVPLVTWEGGTTSSDLVTVMYGFAAAYAAIMFSRTRAHGWLTVCGIVGGFAFAAKLNAAVILLPAGAVVVVAMFGVRPTFARCLATAGRAALPAVIVASPWFVSNALWTGNPLFPFYNGLFKSPGWPARNESFNFAEFGCGHSWECLLKLPGIMVARGSILGEALPNGILGVLALLGIPLFLVFVPRRDLTKLLPLPGIAAAGLLTWFFLAQYGRYGLPLFPILAILGAMNIEAVTRSLRHARGGLFALAALAVAGFGYVAATRVVSIASNWIIPERFPYTVALGMEKQSAYLSRSLRVYDALRFLDTQPDSGKVLSIGNTARVYTLADLESPNGSLRVLDWMSLTPFQLSQVLRNQGFSVLLIDWEGVQAQGASGYPVLSEDFLQGHAELVFTRHNVNVYRLTSRPAPIRPQNLLANAGFEALDATGLPTEWNAIGKARVLSGHGRGHSGDVSVGVDRENGFNIRVPVSAGKVYTTGHWTRADTNGRYARLQINWLNEHGQVVDVNIRVVPVSSDWKWNEMAASAPAGTASAEIYVSVHEDSVVWFDDFQFVAGQIAGQ